MSLRCSRPCARSIFLTLACALQLLLAASARAQAVLGYGEDATAAPAGAIRVRLSNDWHRTRALGSANDSSYDTDNQRRVTTIGIELGVLHRLTIGVSAPWVTTKALTFISSTHAQRQLLDTLYDTSHNGWGNVEAVATVVWLGEPGQQARLAPQSGVHVRSALVAGALLGTGTLSAPADPFVVGTSDRARGLIARSATDVTVGSHVFTSIVGRYEKPTSDNVLVAVRPANDPFTRDVVPFVARRTLGARYELEITPRYQIGRYFAIGVQYRYHHGAEDRYQGTLTTDVGGQPVTLDASTLDAGTGITEHRAGFGIVYSSVDAYSRGHSRFPFEVTLEHSNVVSISGNRPKDSETKLSIRFFHRFRGREFAPPAVARNAATP